MAEIEDFPLNCVGGASPAQRWVGDVRQVEAWPVRHRASYFNAAFLRLADDSVLRLTTDMIDVAVREEFGQLCASPFDRRILDRIKRESSDGGFDFSIWKDLRVKRAEAIVLLFNTFRIDSGLRLICADGRRIVIVAATFPCHVAVFNETVAEGHDAECSMSDYSAREIHSDR